jgi:protein-tyrosine phosphatase
VTVAAGAPAPTVLFVCTGNVCRSPAAELLLRNALGPAAGLQVTSAGLGALVGEPVAPPMARLLHERGVDPEGFQARQLDPAQARAAAVVLTMTVQQRAAVVLRVPATVRRTFTLTEFADLLGLVGPPSAGTPGERLAAQVAAAGRGRGLRAVSADDDVEDPYRRPDEVFTRVFARIADTVDRLVPHLGLPHAA